MGTRRILVTWFFLLLFTLLFGVLTMRLLNREQSRLDEAAERAAIDRIEVAAENVRVAVAGIRQQVMESVEAMPRDDLTTALTTLERENPLIRNTFVWRRGEGVIHPQSGKTLDAEKRDFLRRYASLFDGSVSWQSTADMPEEPQTANPVAKTRQGSYQQLDWTVHNTTKAYWRPHMSSRWISWHWTDQLFLLAVVIDEKQGIVHGVELETVALLARLHPALPVLGGNDAGSSIALLDRNDQVIHRVGSVTDKQAASETSVPMGPLLPTYQISGTGLKTGERERGKLFLLLSWLQVATFMLAILGTGSLLLWQAHRNLRDARQKTGFVSNVSHELKTPLTTIRMYAELLGENRVKDPAKRKRYLGVIVNESQRLGRLVNNVLDFGRLEQSRRRYEVSAVSLHELLPHVLEAHNTEGRSPCGVDWLEPEEPAWVQADPDALEQILLNILDNACKYGNGSEIQLHPERTGNSWTLHVLDRGPGVPSAHRQKIFEKFHRVDDTLISSQSGSGLGLSIAQRLARGMGGDISYRDRPGGGSDFAITLPAAQPPVSLSDSESPQIPSVH